MSGLSGQRALVTGAGVRVGRSIATALGRAGMRVALHYHRSASGAEAAAADIRAAGGDALTLQADLGDRAAARGLVDRALEALGGLDLLVASAASFERVPFDELSDESFDRSLQFNLASTFSLAHQAVPALRESRGSLVFITCSSASTPFRNYLPYVVSKGAVQHLMRTLALELAPEVRVNAVAPGTVLPPPDMPAPTVDALRRSVPLQRLGSPDDIARAVLFLAESPFVTGQELIVDGGRALAKLERFG